jgi:hypothetical protein
MTTTTTTARTAAVAKLGRFDRVYSDLHGKWVRFGQWTSQDSAEVLDSDTCEPLPDEVNRSQLRTW